MKKRQFALTALCISLIGFALPATAQKNTIPVPATLKSKLVKPCHTAAQLRHTA